MLEKLKQILTKPKSQKNFSVRDQGLYRGAQLNDAKQRQRVEERHRERRQRLKQQRIEAWRKRVRAVLTFIVLAALVLAIISRLYVSGVDVKNIAGEEQGSTKTGYQTDVNELLQQQTFHFVKLFVDDKKLADGFASMHPELEDISVKDNFISNRLLLEYVKREPVLVWESQQTGTLAVDDDGVLFDPGGELSKSLPTVKDTSKIIAEPGDVVLPPATIEFINNLRTELSKQNLELSTIKLTETVRQFDIRVKGVEYAIKLTTNRGVKPQVKDIIDARKHFEAANATPKEYLDIRIEGKAAYR